MKVQVLLFAGLKEECGTGMMQIELSQGAVAADVIAAVAPTPAAAERWRGIARVAVNAHYRPIETVLHDGDEVALIPPVAGG